MHERKSADMTDEHLRLLGLCIEFVKSKRMGDRQYSYEYSELHSADNLRWGLVGRGVILYLKGRNHASVSFSPGNTPQRLTVHDSSGSVSYKLHNVPDLRNGDIVGITVDLPKPPGA